MIEPSFAILDEIDSGLDIDALKVVSKGVNSMRGDNFGSLIITHLTHSIEIHAIMGPNGTGKSTLSQTIMGQPGYTVTEGEILLNGENILEMPVDERARKGLFLAMQYPAEIQGVTNAEFLRAAINARRPIS